MTQEVVMLMGVMASGKTSAAKEFINKGYTHLNRDALNISLDKLLPLLEE